MNVTEEIIRLAKENNGIVTSSMVAEAGFSKGNLTYLVNNEKLEKTARGIYILPDEFEDEFINYQGRFKSGIYSHETALFLHDLTDRTPNKFHMTFPSTYNITNPKREGIRCHQAIAGFYDVGIEEISSPSGNAIRVYNAEKTLCDVLRPRANCDIQIITAAFKQYSNKYNKNIPKLSEYAKLFKVESKVRSYLEVLL